MSTYHVSGMGKISNDAMIEWTEQIIQDVAKERNTGIEEGALTLQPHFDEEYYEQIQDIAGRE